MHLATCFLLHALLLEYAASVFTMNCLYSHILNNEVSFLIILRKMYSVWAQVDRLSLIL